MRPLQLTGERTLPGIWHENYWFQRHAVVYQHLAPLLAGRRVLEAGCGEGYGAGILAAAGATVLGLDYDRPAVAHVRQVYPAVTALRGNLVALPLADGSVDAVVSLQTVEHLWDQPRFVAECLRVLAPRGLLALSTPNRLTFSPGLGRGEKPLNPFHSNELDAAELVGLCTRPGTEHLLLGVRHGPRIASWEHAHGSLVDAQLATPCERWEPGLVTFVTALTAGDFVVCDEDVATSLDLLLLLRTGA